MEAGNELGTVKNQTILTAIPGLRKFPGNLKDLYDNVVEEREKLQKYFIDEGQVSTEDKAHSCIQNVFIRQSDGETVRFVSGMYDNDRLTL